MDHDDYIDILNADGSPTGQRCLKSDVHRNGFYHNTVHVWYYNANAEILLAQRAETKTICPLLWDVSVGGHVDAGETLTQAAVRETQEELGMLALESDLEFIGRYKSFRNYPNGIIDNEFNHTFIAKTAYGLSDLNINKDEVRQIKFVNIPQFRALLGQSDHNGHFIASNRSYYNEILSAVEHKFT